MTPGADNFPSFVVKDIYILARPLGIIFNNILSTGTYPEIWKLIKICLILKGGDLALVNNYRSIAILWNFGNFFEITLYETIYRSVRYLISPSQYGFMTK